MRLLLPTMLVVASGWGCASDCDTICGKLELCQLSCTGTALEGCAPAFDRERCVRTCEKGGAPAGTGGGGGGGQVGAGGDGGAQESNPAGSVGDCATCVDRASCPELLGRGACDAACPEGLRPRADQGP